jgi:carbonic anhydrase/acetyltransferase-like protein (isoleucine patch superfamily)
MILDHFKKPVISQSSFIAETAVILGDVEVDEGASVWYGAVARGDMGKIVIGKNANVQDNVVIHSARGEDVFIGEGTSIGHSSVIHGCRIGKYSIIGMGSVVLSRAEIGDNCIIGAGAVVKEGDKIPDASLVVGVPGKVIKQLSQEQMEYTKKNCQEYLELTAKYISQRENKK